MWTLLGCLLRPLPSPPPPSFLPSSLLILLTQVLYEVCSLLKAQASSMPHPPPSVEAVTTPTGAHPFLTSFQEGSTEDTRSEVEELVSCLNCTGDWTLLHQRSASLLFALMFAFLAHTKVLMVHMGMVRSQ